MSGPSFRPVSAQINFPELEQEVIAYWKKNKIFEKSVQARPVNKSWTFLDGPPFITGLPHYGTLLSSIPKDLFPRYWTMKGHRVRRVWGWDCHGLPAENKVEAKLKIKRKKDIEEKIGVKQFIEECKTYVRDVSSEWEWYVDHIGRWVDFQNAYKTMDPSYMETVLWVFKQLYDKGLIYKGLRVSLYCPHCGTPISNFEVAMDADNYQEVTEPTAVFMYLLKEDPATYLLAWSTTPWNKLATPALAVNPKLDYVKIKQADHYYILAKSTLPMLKNNPAYKIVQTFKGKELVGKEFIPHYNFYKIEPGKKAFFVVGAPFVTAEEGTGIVTLAAYGEEDLAVMQKENIQLVLHVDEEGIIKKDVPQWADKYYLEVDPLVIDDLSARGLIYRVDQYKHTVPTCWRCHTRLFYAPQDAWYVDVQKLKPSLKKNNEAVHWFPAHFKYGRFLKSMEAAPDWCISRSRYWGSPVPVWECPSNHRFVPGSIAELERIAEITVADLHKPMIDEIKISCPDCGKLAKRVSEVLDSWIEAGSAPFAERHFPFAKNLKLEEFFPPDFIVEYTGQIRAWFYVLHVIATALYDSQAFKNVVVTGVILGTDGRKMSKNYHNYPDPKEMLTKYGGDALRLYLLGSPVMLGQDIRISEIDYRNQVRGILLLFWNVYNFFITYALIDRWEPAKSSFTASNIMDRWILSRLYGNLKEMTEKGYEKYNTPKIVECADTFIHDLSQWYVRRIRDRIGPTASAGKDKDDAYQTLWLVLTVYSQALAPLIPFVTEEIYRNLTGQDSVHLTDWPILDASLSDKTLEEAMADGQKVVSAVHALRKTKKVKTRTPLKKLSYTGPRKLISEVQQVVLSEINVYELNWDEQDKNSDYSIWGDTEEANQDQKAGAARELVRQIQLLRRAKGCKIDESIEVMVPKKYQSLGTTLIDYIRRESLIKQLTWSDLPEISIGSAL